MEFLALLLSLPFLYIAFQRYRDARHIQNMPTMTIASAPQGLVEIRGKTTQIDRQTHYVPIINEPCVWYRYEEVEISDHDDEQVTEIRTSEQRFYVADDTGICAIDPMYADVHPGTTRDVEDADQDMIHRLSWIGVNEDIFVLGWMHTLHPTFMTDEVTGQDIADGNVKDDGLLKEQLNRITHAPRKSLPYIISSHVERRLVDSLLKQVRGWLVGFFVSITILFLLIKRFESLF